MRYSKTDTCYIIRLDKGEQVVSTLTEFCETHTIKNATFSGIGAVDELTCGYYELASKQYHFTEYHEPIEVVSLTGNVMLKEDKPFIHVHGVFTDTRNVAFGGHIKEMRVGVVLEVILTPLTSSLKRIHDECIGLFLIDT